MSRSFAVSNAPRFPTLDSGEGTMDRRFVRDATVQPSSGFLRLTFFRAERTETVTQVKLRSGATAAAATPTLVRIGVYSVDTAGALTLVGSTANDTTLFAATNTSYTKALQASFTKTAGTMYAVGTLVVSAGTTPAFHGALLPSNFANETLELPAVSAHVPAQTDLPASVARGSLVANSGLIYVELLP